MPEEKTGEEHPEKLHRYRVQLDGNRGETVMKLSEKDAEAMGDRVLEDLGEAKMYGFPEEETKHADQTATKSHTPANKSKSAAKDTSNK